MSKINLNARVEESLFYELNCVAEFINVSRTDLVNLAIEQLRETEHYKQTIKRIEEAQGISMAEYVSKQIEERKTAENGSNRQIEPSEEEELYKKFKSTFLEYDRLRGDING